MIDCNGNKLHIGDKVVFIKKTYCTAGLSTGKISGFQKCFGKDCAIIGEGYFKDRSMEQSIMLLERGDNDK